MKLEELKERQRVLDASLELLRRRASELLTRLGESVLARGQDTWDLRALLRVAEARRGRTAERASV